MGPGVTDIDFPARHASYVTACYLREEMVIPGFYAQALRLPPLGPTNAKAVSAAALIPIILMTFHKLNYEPFQNIKLYLPMLKN
jgi:hypothetical protein